MSDDELQQAVPELRDEPVVPARPSLVPRFLLLALHIVALCLALSLAPSGYAFQLGAYTGTIVIFGCIGLWVMLFVSKTTRGLLLFCLLAVVQVGFVAVVALQFQAEERIGREVEADANRQKQAWADQMAEFSLAPLYQMLNGEQPVTLEELKKTNAIAKGGEAELLKIKSESEQWEAQAFERFSKISYKGALEFRRGLESRQAEEDELLSTLQAIYLEAEQLTEFLIQREGHYHVKKGTFEFESARDSEMFNDLIANLTHSNEKLDRSLQKTKEKTEQLMQSEKK
jgi:hypothetical protein